MQPDARISPRRPRLVAVRLALAATAFVGLARASTAPTAAEAGPVAAAAALSRAAWTSFDAPTVDVAVVDLALGAATCAIRAGLADDPSTLTVIDFRRRSVERRLWVFDLDTGALLHHELVAHGSGTGNDLATAFSNQVDSHQSSLGMFVAAETYVGKHGYSLRLDGLERGFNDRARERAIVVHGASYVSEQFAREQGRLGRSWGCPALSPSSAGPLIDRIKGGGLVFAYYPDQAWLNGSRLLGECPAASR